MARQPKATAGLTDRQILLDMLLRARHRGQLRDEPNERAKVIIGADDSAYVESGGDPNDLMVFAGGANCFARFQFNADGSLNTLNAWEIPQEDCCDGELSQDHYHPEE